MTERRNFKEVVLDTIHEYFGPIRELYRYCFEERYYRVSYTFDGGMTLLSGEQTFTALHDRQAHRTAQRIAGSDHYTLEHFRTLKR